MEIIPSTANLEQKNEHFRQPTLQEKVQKLIDNFTTLKEKHASLKEEYETTLTNNIELEDTNNQLMSEKMYLEQKVAQITEHLQTNLMELNVLKEKNLELENLTLDAVSKIDQILNQCEME